MLIPSRIARLLRKYESLLFRSSEPLSRRQESFYKVFRPCLLWTADSLKEMGLESHEVESELYILSCNIFKHYDPEKSSIIPYLSKRADWYISDHIESVSSRYRPLKKEDISNKEWSCVIDEEFYWRTPGILFENKYVGKCFTRSEKYLISMIIAADDRKLSHQSLANMSLIGRRRMKKMLLDIGEQLNWRNPNGR